MKSLVCLPNNIILLLFLLTSVPVSAANVLTVQDPDNWGTAPGYIDKATLVIEPHGGYVEQSLYLTYSDHNQFAAGSKLEIVHRFELPEGAVINDLWLWIGDSVMQGVMMDTWKARSIYDSIVVFKRDPAFLSKDGNQYELHIYPLAPGGNRRVKINFITPTKWFGNTATAELPLKILNSNNAAVKPLEIFFKESQNVWGNPSLLEWPNAVFQDFVDTLGYNYKYYKLENTANFESLNLQFQPNFVNGYFGQCFLNKDKSSYFQIGFTPGEFFNLTRDTSSHKYLIGLDLSGAYNKNIDILVPNLENILMTALGPNDHFKIIIAGAGEITDLSGNWIKADSANIYSVFNEFMNSGLADSIKSVTLPTIVYCDHDASNGWQFPGIDQFAVVQNYGFITQAVNYFSLADIIAAYRHGFDDAITPGDLEQLLSPLDDFFDRGGRLLSYYDYNRDNTELLASHYINGLKTLGVIHGPVKLYRNLKGNIGSSFPESITHESSYFLAYNDSSVKVELADNLGRPAVISKRIKNGLLVVSGIWQLNDDGAMKMMLDIPLLGLNKPSNYFQLKEILDTIKVHYNSDRFDKVLLFSNSDSLFQKYDAISFVGDYLKGFKAGRPVFNTVNLLNAKNLIPPSITEDNTDYYGSGYLTKVLSDSTSGLHFETNTDDWNYIAAVLSPTSLPNCESFELKCTDDTLISKISNLREINPVIKDPNKPRFFIGSSTAQEGINFEVTAKYAGEPDIKTRQVNITVNRDSVEAKNDVIPAMLGNEELKDLFRTSSYDTTAIVNIAMKYRLLCDYTAFLALEPNDTLHFMRNPNDEGGYTTSVKDTNKTDKDTVILNIYPNPFNIQTSISVSVKAPSVVKISVYNIMGQLVKVIEESDEISGRKIYSWNGRNSHNVTVSSGIYFVNAIIRERGTGKITVGNKKMILLK